MSEAWVWLLMLGVALLGVALVVSPGGPLPQVAILSPAPREEVGLPARVVLGNLPGGAEIGVRLLDSYGRVLAEDAARADPAGQVTLEVYYDLPASPRGRLEVFLPVPGLDREVIAARRIKFSSVPYRWVKLYFLDPEGRPFPLIRRVPRTQTPATQTLQLLLRGPSWRERVRGYWTALPEGTALSDLSISAGVAEVRLAGGVEELSPELRTLALLQVEKTLLEFSTINQVRVYAGEGSLTGFVQ
ncbi:hypothetical protein DRJ54_03345 [Candidatus Acetothermia bacterium]|nr:MAG: hypothetical protein DRJ54_03345 [Candidatus Acetothermia bacterium]